MKKVTLAFACILVLLVGCSSANQEKDTIDSKNEIAEASPSNSLNPSASIEPIIIAAPYIGMRESTIETTLLGNATSIEECRDFKWLDNKHKWKKYIWDYGDGKKLVAKIYYDNGYGEVVSIDKYPKDAYGNTIAGYWD